MFSCEISSHKLCCFKVIKGRRFNMASRKTTPRKKSGKRRKGKTRAELKKLLKRAEAEIKKLLKGDRAGTLTGARLTAGLEEIEDNLKEINPLELGK
jgi:hypothetical protein